MNLTSKKAYFRRFYFLLGLFLYKVNLSPNFVTSLSLISGTFAGICFYYDYLITAAFLLFLSGLLDLLDGELARLSGRPTKFGAVFDWIADKWVDGVVLGTIAYVYTDAFWTILAIVSSMLHSFIKPVVYAEIGYQVKLKGKIQDPLENTGFFGRPETHLSLLFFTFLEKLSFYDIGLEFGIKLITLLSLASFISRLVYLYQNFRGVKDE
ncbi:CDP-alcohol phosphatidyltransferase family protein [Thermodesulfobacterium sp. TA1]|uniref:CDP-alcohol phosphatidyltransferase family protein n=1 Tax=Thermodesulfobacterium sp. TA1 TaxID=2234087 RepID=UPI0012322E66|nr:CDP-alcohol phosphatidyltransferase family protein [Thermodesulfobacterium sp. TA1]QER42290.1 CDP-alcohol phosphatidyltransferase family protein [Thermodesulfobacterium sp. TA1]